MERKLIFVSMVMVCVMGIAQAGVIMTDGFDADTLEANGWDTTTSNWNISTGSWGNPGHYIWGGGGTAGQEDIDSGRLVKDTGYVIQAGDTFTVTFDMKSLADADFGGSLLVGLGYVDGTGEQILGAVEYLDTEIPYGWNNAQGTLTVTATAGAVGNNLYIGIGAGPNAWNGTSAQRIGVDNVVIEQIPEPATLALLGLGGLLSLKRRRS